jgi:Skp family chaperone for outer membrane proteins
MSGAPLAQPAGDRPVILIVDQERLLTGSIAGQAALAAEEADRAAIAAEGRRLDAELAAEERRLTGQRDAMSPEEFRDLADAFDDRVIEARQGQEDSARAAAERAEQRRRAFFAEAAPILTELMQETGAAAVVDIRLVLIANQNLNITDEAIKRLDAATAATDPGGAAPATTAP